MCNTSAISTKELLFGHSKHITHINSTHIGSPSNNGKNEKHSWWEFMRNICEVQMWRKISQKHGLGGAKIEA